MAKNTENAIWLDESKTFEERAKALVSEMTLEEKVFQTLFSAPAIPRLGVPAYNYWNEALHGVARAGVATVFPQAIGLAAAFDEEMIEKIADIISTEARGKFNMQQAACDAAEHTFKVVDGVIVGNDVDIVGLNVKTDLLAFLKLL